MSERGGNYPIVRRAGEIERLRAQAEAMAFDAGVMLDRIGDMTGWRVLDVGCGAGGITDQLSARVGPSGSVLGLDGDAGMVEASRQWAESLGLANVAYVEGDGYATGLPRASFDLVHVRFVMSTAGEAERLLAELLALAGPGGVVAAQEPDIYTQRCHPPHPAWDRLCQALHAAFSAIGGNVNLANNLYRLFRTAGLADVNYRPFLVGTRSTDPFVDYLPQTMESIRETLREHAIIDDAALDEAIAQCRAHLADPDTVFDSYLVAQVWGRKAG